MSASQIYNNTRSFAQLRRDTHFYHSLYDVCFFSYWFIFLAKKTVVCIACEDAGSPWGLDTEVRSWSKFSFSLLTSIRRGTEIPTCQNTNGVNSEDHNVHICVGLCLCLRFEIILLIFAADYSQLCKG
jgi:hypothetical protein